MIARLTHDNHLRSCGLQVHEVDLMNMDHKERRELADLLESNVAGMVSYDAVSGWSLHTVFDAPYL